MPTLAHGPYGPILRTKLYRPRLTGGLIARPRLTELMPRADQRPLILVSAPAGYGKSVLVSQWVEKLDRPVAWLSLDASDSDPGTFLTYLLAALDRVSPGTCPETQELAAATALPPMPVIADSLLNEIDAMESPCVAVLDDYHHVEPASPVHDLFRRFLDHPPTQFQLVLVTRRDPPLDLTRLRADAKVHEIRLEDLRFAKSETADFMEAALQHTMSREALDNLENKVEGWATGLRLMTLVLRHVSDHDAFVRNLTTSVPQAAEYLLREVLASQPPELREDLLASSIVSRFCPEMLEAICRPEHTGLPVASTTSLLMKEVRAGNLFAISLDARGIWYRYQHVFQATLQRELQHAFGAERIAELHLRASKWFEDQDLIDDAVAHAITATDLDRALRLIERNVPRVMAELCLPVVEKWLSRIPAELVQQRPILLWAVAWRRYFEMDIGGLLTTLDRIDAVSDDPEMAHLVSGEVTMFRGVCSLFQGDGARALEYLERALDPKEEPLFAVSRALAELFFGLAGQMQGQTDMVVRRLTEWMKDPLLDDPLRQLNLAQALFFIAANAADPAAAAAPLRQARRLAATTGVALGYWNDYIDGLFHLRRGQLRTGMAPLEKMAARKYLNHKRGAIDGMCAQVLGYQLQGMPDRANATLEVLREFVLNAPLPLSILLEACEARLAILQGRREAAIRWLEVRESPATEVMLQWFEIPCLTWCRVLIADGSAARLAEAAERLIAYTDQNEAQHNTCQLIEVLSLRAVACEKQGKAEEALDHLERALSLAEPGGFLMSFLEPGAPMAALLRRLQETHRETRFAERILSVFENASDPTDSDEPVAIAPSFEIPKPHSVKAGADLDRLTNRELDILELLVQRMQNKEIAAKLSISSHTVNDHLKHIYQKLKVKDRRQAVVEARNRGILLR